MKTQHRPKWAKKLSSYDWGHIQEGQATRVPTLRGLRLDAATCRDCGYILAKVKRDRAK